MSLNKNHISLKKFYFILFYFILFYFILFYFILFYFILFYFILFYFILFYFILFYFILFYFILFYFILFYFILFYLGKKVEFNISVKTPKNYPVDLYMLMDMSFSMKDNLQSVETLGKELGRWRIMIYLLINLMAQVSGREIKSLSLHYGVTIL